MSAFMISYQFISYQLLALDSKFQVEVSHFVKTL